ncbi:MAG: 5'/3'-nucleotidase SurE [Alphaproteobacteria bacterium]|nr:MAG: 5'/3'-nucleotidase SurE [Alphaproteobacteria bacterium]
MVEAHRILITNDDGIHAYGLDVLEGIARTISDDVWVVAPEFEQSGAGHGLTLSEPLRIRQVDHKRYAVQGTPTDCVMLAVHNIIKDKRPTLVLSGVNRGANLAEDVTYSGTIAGAMEGVLCGIPSVAFSQVIRKSDEQENWRVAEKYGPEVLRKLLAIGWDRGVLINVNFPACAVGEVKGIEVTRQGFRDESELIVDERVDARGVPYYWFGLRRAYGDPEEDTDLWAVRDGLIAVTPLHLDLTHYAMRERLEGPMKTRY